MAFRLQRICGVMVLATMGAPPARAAEENAVKVVVPQRLPFESAGARLQMPYASNYPIDRPNSRIDRVIVVVHGMERNADQYLANVVLAAEQTYSSAARTLVIAPQFLLPADVAAHKLGDDVLCWKDWADGDASQPPRGGKGEGISSFAVVDRFVELVTDKKVFPQLRRIVIAGHSAGGQFVNRYAAGNRWDGKLDKDRKIRARYVVANPSSYLYFNEERPVLDAKGKLAFAKPTDEKIKACPGYNAYRHGLERLNPYMEATGADNLRAQYAQREVIYLLGTEDTDPNGPGLSKSCASMLEGTTRLERGQFYYAYLRHFFGPEISSRHRLQLVPGAAHSSRQMFTSPAGVPSLFEATAQQ